jgi:hypothetical protein
MWVITFYGFKLMLFKERQNNSGKKEHEDVTVIKLYTVKILKVIVLSILVENING